METAGEGEGVSAAQEGAPPPGLRGLSLGCSSLWHWDGEVGALGWREAACPWVDRHWFCPAEKS